MIAALSKFAEEHSFFTLLILWGAFQIVYSIWFRLPNRIIRSSNIKAQGWPPTHVDADGDLKKDDE